MTFIRLYSYTCKQNKNYLAKLYFLTVTILKLTFFFLFNELNFYKFQSQKFFEKTLIKLITMPRVVSFSIFIKNYW